MTGIDYFFSVLSPFTYLAGDRLERIANRHRAKLSYRPMDIMEVFARTGGTPPRDRHPARQAYRLQDLTRIASHSGLDFNLHPRFWPTDPMPASLAIIGAASRGGGDTGLLCRHVLRACWAENRNIALEDVVTDCLERAGFAADVASVGGDGLVSDSLAPIYAANTGEAIERGVFGSPTYVAGDRLFWGQDRLDHLDSWLGS